MPARAVAAKDGKAPATSLQRNWTARLSPSWQTFLRKLLESGSLVGSTLSEVASSKASTLVTAGSALNVTLRRNAVIMDCATLAGLNSEPPSAPGRNFTAKSRKASSSVARTSADLLVSQDFLSSTGRQDPRKRCRFITSMRENVTCRSLIPLTRAGPTRSLPQSASIKKVYSSLGLHFSPMRSRTRWHSSLGTRLLLPANKMSATSSGDCSRAKATVFGCAAKPAARACTRRPASSPSPSARAD
mmetsp:Transcript_141580/g.440133  ORF Transcript_141580/g.440133 Transcript_141580/m.440133 type:complete len:245 (-) Transcript_141580:433-1167(-)